MYAGRPGSLKLLVYAGRPGSLKLLVYAGRMPVATSEKRIRWYEHTTGIRPAYTSSDRHTTGIH